MNGNVAAAPHFATVGHVFGVLPGAQIMNTICRFEAWEVRSPALQMVLTKVDELLKLLLDSSLVLPL